jgi:hypothetical protein
MTVRDWRQGYGVVDPTDKEVITFALWDRLSYVSGTTTSLQFFATPQTGQNGNLSLAGQLANGTSFLVQAIRIVPLIKVTETAVAAPAAGAADGALQDMFELIRTSNVRFKVGDKEYGNWPTFMLPAAAGVFGGLSVPGTFITSDKTAQYQFASNGLPDPRAAYSFPIPIVIPPQYTFRLLIDWSAAVTLTAGNSDIIAVLDGELMRPKQ